jgi:hypothetical protein
MYRRCTLVQYVELLTFITDSIWDTRGVSAISNSILLEGAWDMDSCIDLIRTMHFIVDAQDTEFAVSARRPDPLDTSSITDLPLVFHIGADCHNHAGTFMASDAFCCFLHVVSFGASQAIGNQRFVGATQAGPEMHSASEVVSHEGSYHLRLTKISLGPGITTLIF